MEYNQFDVAMYLFLVFGLKHFVVDFIFQGPYMYRNKHKYGHPGGLLHAGLHGVTSFWFIFMMHVVPILFVAVICLGEIIIHYHIDWAKMNINRATGWKPDNSEYFWWLLGLDQLLHFLTYWWMTMLVAV